jgi:hypothetical protein
MGTRGQIRILVDSKNPGTNLLDRRMTLYCCDGSPEKVIPAVYCAWQYRDEWNDGKTPHGKQEGPDRRFGRIYKVAGLLCWAAPTDIEPLPYHFLHSEIKFFYEMKITDEQWDYNHEPPRYIPPTWEITIYKVGCERYNVDDASPPESWKKLAVGLIDDLIDTYKGHL